MLGSLPSPSIKLNYFIFFFLRLILSPILQHVIKYGVVRTSRKHGTWVIACSAYLKDNKKIQIAHDSEGSVASGIHFCKHSA